MAALLAAMVAGACGGGGGGGGSSTTAPPTTIAPATTPATSVAPSTTPSTIAAPTTTAPPPRTVSVGAPFGVRVGEAVNVSGAGLLVTFSKVVSDSRCRPGQRCLVAGDATIAVAVATTGRAPGSLTLNTDAPKSARYGSRTVELVRLGSGSAPTATLRVT